MIDLPALFDVVSGRHTAIGEVVSGPEQLAIDSLVKVFLVRGREALDRFTRSGADPETEKALFAACNAGIACKTMLRAAHPSSEPTVGTAKSSEIVAFLADLQLLMVELFDRIHAESTPESQRVLH